MNYPLIILAVIVAVAYAYAIVPAILAGRARVRKKKRTRVPLTAETLQSIARPAIGIARGESSFSRIGGLPDLPKSQPWPLDPKGRPLAFLCQIAFEELPETARNLGLPASGVVFFFYSQDQSFGGANPEHLLSWRVINLPETPPAEARDVPPNLKPKNIYRSASLSFATFTTYPDLYEAQMEALGIDGESYAIFRYEGERRSAVHMIGGYPDAIHDEDMGEICELASNGIHLGDRKALRSREAEALRQRPRDWRLLLQLDTDDAAGMSWGDAGRLYFWIRASDLAENDFSKVWMIGQCY